MLGLLHKCTLGIAHPRLLELFPQITLPSWRYMTKQAVRRHDRQILERCKGNFLEITRNSLFGLVRVYNFLPEHIVHSTIIKDFQKKLTAMARECCNSGSEAWPTMFSPRHVRQG